MTTSTRAEKLLALVDLVSQAAQTVVREWALQDDCKDNIADHPGSSLSSFELYNAQRIIIAACGAFTELVHTPQTRLIEVAMEFIEARALHIAAEHYIADHLAKVEQTTGMSLDDLSKATGIESQKLARIMRCLTSNHIFSEVRHGRFANNSVSTSLVQNEPLRGFILLTGSSIYMASDKLPDVLRNSIECNSTDVSATALQVAYGTKLPPFEWLEEQIEQPDGTIGPRPEFPFFVLGMIGIGRIQCAPLYEDFPWESLGSATIVDVGGGVGGMSIDLCKRYSNLAFVVQDRAHTIKEAKAIWRREQPGALETGRVQLMPHNFFEENPVKHADVYLLRYVLHNWEDDLCVDILKAIRPALGSHSRILIADVVMNTTLGCIGLPSAPYPLPADYGIFTRWAHALDLTVMSLCRGAERTVDHFHLLAKRAGLVIERIWECRGIMHVTEMRLPQAAEVVNRDDRD
ncbi:hypothetical protein AcW1_006336 [Taiwanofungus camphoratus]|nr:hypothetical protein AcV5_008926 [Antrodia cinnamomea]KAI0924134.1 hypothetical protein AcW2_005100 [Antrodia cinnamomea]KAI0941012.1 hypothetical protein AcV7_003233 [Antrodia cinnamomea]KAI0954444.1 hypothetical protein AcW1_006336 [Antrodia cinnamomea]